MSEGIFSIFILGVNVERYVLSPTPSDRIRDDEAMELIRATPAQGKRRGRGGGGPKVTSYEQLPITRQWDCQPSFCRQSHVWQEVRYGGSHCTGRSL